MPSATPCKEALRTWPPGAVDSLVNNAGGSRAFELDSSDAQCEEAMTLNFTRQRQPTHALLQQTIARNWGRIINITGKSEPEDIANLVCFLASPRAAYITGAVIPLDGGLRRDQC